MKKNFAEATTKFIPIMREHIIQKHVKVDPSDKNRFLFNL